MIVLFGTGQISKHAYERALDELCALCSASLSEAGCNRYQFSLTIEDDHTFCIFEEWQDRESLSMHVQSSHLQNFSTNAHEFLDGPTTTFEYVVSEKNEIGKTPDA